MAQIVESLVSVIIPVYNRPTMLREAVASALAQTHRPIEVIIVDDGSTDDTAEVGQTLQQEHSEVRYVRQGNAGAAEARNTGLGHARGEFIQYLDSDDLLAPRKVEVQIRALRENPECGVSYCTTLRADGSGREVPWARTAERFETLLPDFLMQRGWATLTPLWKRHVCDAIGPWKPLRVMEDWEHDCRAGVLGVRAVHCPEPLATVRDHTEHRAGSLGNKLSAVHVRDYFAAHRSIIGYLKAANQVHLATTKDFSRKLFFIARRCGDFGLSQEAHEALQLALQISPPKVSTRGMRLFDAAARLLGWRIVNRFGNLARTLKPQSGV